MIIFGDFRADFNSVIDFFNQLSIGFCWLVFCFKKNINDIVDEVLTKNEDLVWGGVIL